MNGIRVQNLTKKFKKFSAVSDISFEVKNNSITGFLGPNGAGKTTAMRMLVGLSRPTDGEVEIAGNKIKFGDSSTNKLFGYLPEQPSFYNWMTGLEYLNFIAETFKIIGNKKTVRISELLTIVDLTDARKRRIGTYSNGMKQRLGIAQALINDPEVLIMDEPVSALDPIGRREVINIIEKLKKSKTIFLSTHILSDVDRICDDVIIIDEGKIIVSSSLSELKEKYAKPILEVEFLEDPSSILPKLKSESWVLKFEVDSRIIKIWLKESKVMDDNLPLKFFAKQNIGVTKYGMMLPETEDLFLDLVSEKK